MNCQLTTLGDLKGLGLYLTSWAQFERMLREPVHRIEETVMANTTATTIGEIWDRSGDTAEELGESIESMVTGDGLPNPIDE